jgi:hypothetical protein
MTEAEIKTKVDDFLTNLWTTIKAREATYLAANGKYWQGLVTHSVTPAEGADVVPNLTATSKPTDIAEKWTDVFTVPATMPCSVKVDTYSGPKGIGYVGTVRVSILGQTWERSQQFGPESWRTEGWHNVTSIL